MARDTKQLQGLDNTLDMLAKLPAELVSKRGGVVLSALRKGGAVMRKAIREEIKRIIAEPNIGGVYYSTGFLEKSIATWRSRRPRRLGGNEALSVGPRSRAVYPDGTRASLVMGVLENGTEHMEAKAPVRKAFDAKKEPALQAVIKGANDGIERAIKKLDKRR